MEFRHLYPPCFGSVAKQGGINQIPPFLTKSVAKQGGINQRHCFFSRGGKGGKGGKLNCVQKFVYTHLCTKFSAAVAARKILGFKNLGVYKKIIS